MFKGKFLLNGSCGYQRKPWFQTRDPISLEPIAVPQPSEANQVTKLTVEVFSYICCYLLMPQVLSARALPKSDKFADPHVELELVGVVPDCKVLRTKPISILFWYLTSKPCRM